VPDPAAEGVGKRVAGISGQEDVPWSRDLYRVVGAERREHLLAILPGRIHEPVGKQIREIGQCTIQRNCGHPDVGWAIAGCTFRSDARQLTGPSRQGTILIEGFLMGRASFTVATRRPEHLMPVECTGPAVKLHKRAGGWQTGDDLDRRRITTTPAAEQACGPRSREGCRTRRHARDLAGWRINQSHSCSWDWEWVTRGRSAADRRSRHCSARRPPQAEVQPDCRREADPFQGP